MSAVQVSGPASAATSGSLTRYPYLTDSIQSSITVNWATDRSATTGTVTYGPAGTCTGSTVTATSQNLTVPPANTPEYQWKAVLPVTPDTTYCYRVQLGSSDLLGSDPSPQFTSQVRAGNTTPFSFAVFGDWGQAYAGGVNVDQTNVLQQIASSGSRFAVMTGDTAYPGGSQMEYGDLQQVGTDIGTVFGRSFWAVPGRSIPVFNVTGNHGFTNGAVQVLNWPETNAAASSGGKYLMEPYPSINGSTAKSYPSMWYAVDAGPARIYALTAAWADGNPGTATVYQTDRDAHWTTSSQEYQWLAADLAAHPNAVKIAFWHYPLRADSSGQPDDTFLQGGAGSLEGLLNQYQVKLAFNGHAHGYQRNAPDSGGLVTYVVGNGGAALGGVSGCKATDLYAIGSGGSHCGAAPSGLPNSRVFGFVKVTVNDHTVTVTPTDSLGGTYDIQTYTAPGGTPDGSAPSQPGSLSAAAPTASAVNLSWTASTDNVGVTGYRVYRNGSTTPLATVTGGQTTYSDATVTASTAYTYQVSAVDAASNESTKAAASVTTPAAGSVQTFTFNAAEDATIDASQPTVALGTGTRITVDNSPVNNALVKFAVSGLPACSTISAKLQLTVGNGGSDNSAYGGDVYSTSTGWSQSTVTWNTAPAPGVTTVGSVPTAVALSTPYQFDVSPLVTGNGAVAFYLKSTSSDGARYYSTEGGTAAQAPQLLVSCTTSGGGTGGDTVAPSQPGSFTAAAPTSAAVNLSWAASTDNVGVTGYRVYKNGSATASTTVTSGTTYTDTAVAASTDYTYQVSAVDEAGNESTKASASVTTPAAGGGGGQSFTFTATEDATIDASQPAVALGTGTRITVDNSPVNDALVTFAVSGLNGCTVTSATLRLTVGTTANDNSAYGGDVYSTTGGWSQSTVTFNTAPVPVGGKVSSVSTAVALSTAYLFDVTPLVSADGTVSFYLKSTSSDGARYFSTEGGTGTQKPQLLVTC